MRLVRPPGAGRLSARRHPRAFAAAASVFLLLVGCGRRARSAEVSVDWTLAPDLPGVGSATLVIRLADLEGRPLPGAHVRVEATMSHPGMRPVLADAVERAGGRYEAPLVFTMAGAWVALVSGSLPDGRTFTHRIDLPPVRPSAAR